MQNNKIREEVLTTLVKRFNRAWPKAVFHKEELLEWADPIGHLDVETAEEVIKFCVVTHKWRPTISEFLDVSRQIIRRQHEATIADDTPISDFLKDLQRKGLAVQRSLMEQRAPRQGSIVRGHDHTNGWESCAVCTSAERDLASSQCETCQAIEANGMTATHCKGF